MGLPELHSTQGRSSSEQRYPMRPADGILSVAFTAKSALTSAKSSTAEPSSPDPREADSPTAIRADSPNHFGPASSAIDSRGRQLSAARSSSAGGIGGSKLTGCDPQSC